jgi:hypothetical protein
LFGDRLEETTSGTTAKVYWSYLEETGMGWTGLEQAKWRCFSYESSEVLNSITTRVCICGELCQWRMLQLAVDKEGYSLPPHPVNSVFKYDHPLYEPWGRKLLPLRRTVPQGKSCKPLYIQDPPVRDSEEQFIQHRSA